jgi:hypothetical protein
MTILTKVFAVAVLLILVCCGVLQGQAVSPLFQVMSSNPLIDRPEVFREMQRNIDMEFGKTPPGLHLDVFYQKMYQAEDKILSYVQSLNVRLTPDSTAVKILFIGDSLEIRFRGVELKNILDSIKREVAARVSAQIAHGLESFQSQDMKDAVIQALKSTVEESGLLTGIENTEYKDNDEVNAVSKEVAAALLDGIERIITTSAPVSKAIRNLTEKDIAILFYRAFSEFSTKVKSGLTDALTMAEHKVARLIDQVSDDLVSANVGVGVTEGTGAFSGGFTYSVVYAKNFQGIAYVNGKFTDTSHSQTASSLLVGAQFRFAFDPVQCDLLMSKLVGANLSSAWEFGIGGSVRTQSDLVFGVAAFISSPNKFWSDDENTYTVGATFKGTSRNSPTLLLGGIFRHEEKTTPIIQLGLPVFTSK